MMTSSNGNIFRVTGHLCGVFTDHRWIPRKKVSDAELWCFLWSAPLRPLWRHCNATIIESLSIQGHRQDATFVQPFADDFMDLWILTFFKSRFTCSTDAVFQKLIVDVKNNRNVGANKVLGKEQREILRNKYFDKWAKNTKSVNRLYQFITHLWDTVYMTKYNTPEQYPKSGTFWI